jgi:hypothetical protein
MPIGGGGGTSRIRDGVGDHGDTGLVDAGVVDAGLVEVPSFFSGAGAAGILAFGVVGAGSDRMR